MVCINASFACVITFSRGSMCKPSNRGAVCALYLEFVMILMAFFCCRNILFMLDCDVQLYMFMQLSKWE